MKVERFTKLDNNDVPQMLSIRILHATCPECKKAVEFALSDDDFVKDEIISLEMENNDLRQEILRLHKVIDRILEKISK